MCKDVNIVYEMELLSKDYSDDLNYLTSFELATKEEYLGDNSIYCDEQDEVRNPNFHLDAEPIPITKIKDMIKDAESVGANFVSIDWHCDHREYEVFALKLTRLTDEELKAKAIIKVETEKTITLKKIKEYEEIILKLKRDLL